MAFLLGFSVLYWTVALVIEGINVAVGPVGLAAAAIGLYVGILLRAVRDHHR